MTPIPYLFFKDTCAEAMRFYADTFGTDTLELMPVSGAPEEVRATMPDADADLIMHAALKLGDGWIYASDDLSGGEAPQMSGVSVNLSFPTVEEGKRVFDALSQGGEVRMPYAPVFFAPGFGALTDRFGIRWMIMTDASEAAV